MYDSARDIFTKADDNAAKNENTPEPRPSKKRKLSQSSPASDSQATENGAASIQNTEAHGSTTEEGELQETPKKVEDAASVDGTAPPKEMNAANLSKMARFKKAPSDRGNERKKPALKRREKFPRDGRRSRSPARGSSGTPKRVRTPQHREPSPPAIPRSPSRSPPRKLKRPGAGARVDAVAREIAQKKQQEREEQAKAELARRGVGHVTTQHYNEATIMSQQERRTQSKIIGLRDFNNWVKSAVIQKFSPNDGFVGRPHQSVLDKDGRPILVLDLGCGKAGDLQKWEKAPQKVGLLVGLDPAENLVEEARRRYRGRQQGNRGIFEAHFIVRDCFGLWLGEVPIVREVGIDGAVGPDGSLQAKRFGGGGFDVVSMMFCLHYAFESEELARGMLRNVAGSLKRGGRFLGVIVNSDMIAGKINEHYKAIGKTSQAVLAPANKEDDDEDDWDPEKPSDEPAPVTNGAATQEDSDSDWDPEKPSVTTPAASEPSKTPLDAGDSSEPYPEWGNSIYQFKFLTKPPTDGVFRPPFGWKYDYKLEEAVATPEFVVPWEALRALALDYDLELQWRKPFMEVWETEKDDPVLGELGRRMKVVRNVGGPLVASEEEQEASSFYHAFCFYKT